MKTQNPIRALQLLLLLFCLITSSFLTRGAYPTWNADMDGRRGPVWVGYGGSLFYATSISDRAVVMRWSPEQPEDEEIAVCNYYSFINAMAVHDGHLYIAGTMTNVWNSVSDVSVHGIAKIALPSLIITDAVTVTVTPIPYSMVWDHNGVLYIGGIGWTASGAHYETNAFKKWSGSSWDPVGGGLYASVADQSGVRSLATDGTNIYVGGTFLGVTNGSGGLLPSTNLVKWNVDTASWTAMGISPEQGTIGWVTGLAVSGTNVLAAGSFSGHDGVRRFANPSGAALSIGTANGDTTEVIALYGDFYIVGDFTSIGSVTTTGIAKWSNGTWSALGSGLGDAAFYITANVNSIFVSGNFYTAGGISTPNNSARWQLSNDDRLQFTSGSLSGSSVSLSLAGLPNLQCQVERLDFPSDVWVDQGDVLLNTSGTGSFSSSVTNGLGYFRARSVDGGVLSTNAFGSIVGTVPPGYWLVGTPFSGMTVSNMFPSPYGGTSAHYMTNGNLSNVTWDDLDNVWTPGDRALAAGEGVLVFTPNNLSYRAYGLFYTNFSRTLPTNYSIITSPIYHKYAGGSATQIDEFNTTRLGGYSLVPVNSSANPKARASRNKAGVANQYIDYVLTTGGDWQTNSVSTTVPILIGEGVWIENRFGSSQTWAVPLSIW